MCGITGIIFKTPPTEKQLKTAKGLFTKLLGRNQIRGHYATGVALLQNGQAPLLHKESIAALDFVKGEGYRSTLAEAGEDTAAIMGHTRWPTQGALTWANNQPILYDRIVGVHNGHISNDHAIFSRLGLKRHGEVDSEAVFAAACHLLDGPSCKARAEKAQDIGNLLQGRATVVLMDHTRPSEFLVIKKHNPISIVFVPSLGAFVYTSQQDHLDGVLGRTPRQALDIGEHTVHMVDMASDRIYRSGLHAGAHYNTGIAWA